MKTMTSIIITPAAIAPAMAGTCVPESGTEDEVVPVRETKINNLIRQRGTSLWKCVMSMYPIRTVFFFQ